MPKKRFHSQTTGSSEGVMFGGSTGFANMPQEVVMKLYPKDGPYYSEGLNDGMSGIDSQRSADVNKAKSQPGGLKY